MRRYKKVQFDFRILALNQKKMQSFKRQVRSAQDARVSQFSRDPTVSTVVFKLREGASYSDVVRFLRIHKIKKSGYGIWVSLWENSDIGGVHVPQYVLKLYEQTGGRLDFSYSWLTYET